MIWQGGGSSGDDLVVGSTGFEIAKMWREKQKEFSNEIYKICFLLY